MQTFLKTVLNYRKNSKAIHDGKTIHFAPDNNIYVLFRSLGDETVAHIMNKNDTTVELDLSKFKELGLEGKTVKNLISGEQFLWHNGMLTLKDRGSVILTTKL